MWFRSFKDYEYGKKLKKQSVESGKGIVGCEMNETYGWQTNLHKPKKQKKGLLARLFERKPS